MDFSASINELKEKLQGLTSKGDSDTPAKAKRQLPAFAKPAVKLLGKYATAKEKVLGLEISPHYIRLCQMQNAYGKWSLYQLASSCMENQFTTMDVRMNPDIYVENLQLLLKKHNIKAKDVALSVPTSSSVIKIINMPEMEDEDLDGAAAMGAIWESMVQLEGSIQEYSVYYKVLRHKVKASESLSLVDMAAAGSGSLDGLLSGGGDDSNSLDNLLQQDSVAEIAPVAESVVTEIPTEALSEDIASIGQEIPAAEEVPVSIESENSQIMDHASADSVAQVAEEELKNVSVPAVIETDIIQETPAPVEEGVVEAPEAVVEDVQEEANTMDVLFVATKIADLQLYTDIAQRAGLKPVVVDARCNALKHAFDTNPEKNKIPEPYAMLEFGPDENYLYVIDGDAVSVLPINITDEDKQLTINHENNKEALPGFFQRYAEQLNLVLEHYEKNKRKICNIYVTSSTPLHVEDSASEPLINTFVREIAAFIGAYKLSQCTFCNHIEVPAEFAKKVNAEGNLSAWAAVVGLATYKLDVFGYNSSGKGIDLVNLLPGYKEIIKNRATQLVSTVASAASFIIMMFLAFASYALTASHGSSLAEEIKKLEPIKSQYEDKTKELQRLSVVMGRVKSLDGVRNTLPSNQVQLLTMYKDINNAIPEGVWLANVEFTAPASVELQGNSINDQSILEFVKKLNQSGGFKKVSLKTMQVFENKNDKKATSASGDAASLKKFVLQGDVAKNSDTEKLEILSGGVK